MRIIKVSQSDDRESWLDLRRGIITSTKAKTVKPLSKGKSLPVGIYKILAEKVAIAKDGEKEMDRGLRLENESLHLVEEKYNIKLDLDPGMWMSDDGKLAVSPDGAENCDKPTYAGESKSFDTDKHLMAILNDWEAKKLPNYNPLNSLKIGKDDYTSQVIQYYVVNKDLDIVYFSLYDDRVALENVMHYVIVITRKDVAEFIDSQELYERDALAKVDNMIKILKEIK